MPDPNILDKLDLTDKNPQKSIDVTYPQTGIGQKNTWPK